MLIEDYGHWLLLIPCLFVLIIGNVNLELKDLLICITGISFFILMELLKKHYIVSCPKCNKKIDYTKLWRHDLKCYYCGYKIGDVKLEALKNPGVIV